MKKTEAVQLLNKIIEKTGILELKENIDDFITDFIDDVGGTRSDKHNSDLGLNVKYKRKVNRVNGLSISYFLNNIDNIDSRDISYLPSFLDYLEHAVYIKANYKLSIVTDHNVEYKDFIDAIRQIESRCEMYGCKMNISLTKPVDDGTLNDLVEYFDKELEYYQTPSEGWKEIGTNHVFWLEFTQDIDEDLFKPESDPSDELPSNIISDFKTFTNNLRMSNSKKRELVNIIKRGDWSSLTESRKYGSFWETSNYGDFKVGEHLDKVIFNMFICNYQTPNWGRNVDILRDIKFPTSVETSKGHHLGLAIQVLLDLDLTSAKKFAEDVKSKFSDDVLIVLAEVNVQMKKQPIGYYFDRDLWEPGRYFDKLVSQNKTGIFIYED
jgi:hypothetical protein